MPFTSSEESDSSGEVRYDKDLSPADPLKETKKVSPKRRKRRKRTKEGTGKDALASVRSKGKEVEPVNVQYSNGRSVQIPKSELIFSDTKGSLKKDVLSEVNASNNDVNNINGSSNRNSNITNEKEFVMSLIHKKVPAPRFIHNDILAEVDNSDESSPTNLSLTNGKSSSDDVAIEMMDKEFSKMTIQKDAINKSTLYQNINDPLIVNISRSPKSGQAKVINSRKVTNVLNLDSNQLNNSTKSKLDNVIRNGDVKSGDKILQKKVDNIKTRETSKQAIDKMNEKVNDKVTTTIDSNVTEKVVDKVSTDMANKVDAELNSKETSDANDKDINTMANKSANKLSDKLVKTIADSAFGKILDKSANVVDKVANKMAESKLVGTMVSKSLNKVANKITEKMEVGKVLDKLGDKVLEKISSGQSNVTQVKEEFKSDAKDEDKWKDQVKVINKVKNDTKVEVDAKIEDKAKLKDEAILNENKATELSSISITQSKESKDEKEDDKNELTKKKEDKKGISNVNILLKNRTLFTPSQRLIMLCRKGDWLAVDTLLRQVDPRDFDTSIVSEGNLWTPLMYAAKENRVNIIDKLLDIGYNVNQKAVVSIVHWFICLLSH